MAMKLYTESSVQNIADAIRLKNGLSSKYTVSQMAQAVRDIPLGGNISQYRAILDGTISGSFTCDISSIGDCAFISCEELTSVSFPKCSIIGQGAFLNCFSLSSVDFPVCTSIGVVAFQNCSNLASVSFPECDIVMGSAFQACSKLSCIDIPKCSQLYSYAFRYCSTLSRVVIGTSISSICNLSAITVFVNTPISQSSYLGYFGSIYVPSSLLTQYQAATNWSFYSQRIVGV